MDASLFGLDSPGKAESRPQSSFGLFAVGVTGGAALALTAICYPFVSPALRRVCLPYVPATTQQVSNVLRALSGRRGTLLDIGSGDGRIVFAAARNGFVATGVELNYWLVLYSKFSAFRHGLTSTTTFQRKDLWKFSLQPYNNIVIFGVEEMMSDLKKKFDAELSDTRVAACRFPIPDKEPIEIIGSGVDTVWLYHFKQKKVDEIKGEF